MAKVINDFGPRPGAKWAVVETKHGYAVVPYEPWHMYGEDTRSIHLSKESAFHACKRLESWAMIKGYTIGAAVLALLVYLGWVAS